PGGPGRGAAWSPLGVERYGLAPAPAGALACAPGGRVRGGLLGGPVARSLVPHSASPVGTPEDQVAPPGCEKRVEGGVF
ncbi:sodium/glutamate symporter, partial [Klebsiella pneumoniae]|uniref:sodium/glutamate symporter n=1 Tax=Klebsiella pneumoniae TaxID=573 RepID=UPI002731228E